MNLPSAISTARRGALYLALLSAIGACMGMYFLAIAVADVSAGRWLPSNGGGIASGSIGLTFLAASFHIGRLYFAIRRGRHRPPLNR